MVAPVDLAFVRGQEGAKRALEIAAAGGHPLLIIGPSRTGKSLLAWCLSGILPTQGEERVPLPLQARPKDVEAAFDLRDAVLLFEELPRFAPAALVTFREAAVRRNPSVLLVATMRPCPCGRHPDQPEGCLCTPREVARHTSRLAELEHLFHLRIRMWTVPLSDLTRGPMEPSARVAARVERARRRQEDRGSLNAYGEPPRMEDFDQADLARGLMRDARKPFGLVEENVLRVAQTIADLAGKERIGIAHLAEAIAYGKSLCAGA